MRSSVWMVVTVLSVEVAICLDTPDESPESGDLDGAAGQLEGVAGTERTQRALERVVEFGSTSPQVLDVVTRQTQSLAGEVASGVRARAQSVDDVAERTIRGWLRRPRPQPS